MFPTEMARARGLGRRYAGVRGIIGDSAAPTSSHVTKSVKCGFGSADAWILMQPQWFREERWER